MYDDISRKTERKVIAIFLAFVLLFGYLGISKLQFVHVDSVLRKEVGNAVEYVIEVSNPTEKDVRATIGLTTGTEANDGAVPYGCRTHKKEFKVESKSTSRVKFRFEANQANLLGGKYSAAVLKTD